MRTLVKSNLCKIMDLGVNGNLFGGKMLMWLDEAGAIMAVEEIGGYVVTVKFSEVIFKTPVREKDIVKIYGTVTKVGRTSITIFLEAENARASNTVATTTIVFVHVDGSGNPCPISESARNTMMKKYGLVPMQDEHGRESLVEMEGGIEGHEA